MRVLYPLFGTVQCYIDPNDGYVKTVGGGGICIYRYRYLVPTPPMIGTVGPVRGYTRREKIYSLKIIAHFFFRFDINQFSIRFQTTVYMQRAEPANANRLRFVTLQLHHSPQLLQHVIIIFIVINTILFDTSPPP